MTATVAASANYMPPVAQPAQANSSVGAGQLRVRLNRLESQDPAFDLPINLPTGIFPSNTELHAIGVYEGALPDGETEKPWWSHCTALTNDRQAMQECQQKYAGAHKQKSVTVHLARSGVPIVLALMAYEPVLWKIAKGPGVDIQKIILSGYHGQDIEGIPNTVLVESHSHETSPCRVCTRQPDSFYAYKQDSPEYQQAEKKLQQLTGLNITSFQGSYKSNQFSISYQSTSANRLQTADKYTDNYFSNQVVVAGVKLLLPDGRWRGLAYVKNPSIRGSDEFLVLSRTENDLLRELMVARVQVVADRQGFTSHSACENIVGLEKNTVVNTPLGDQLCYWTNVVKEPWSQSIFNLVAARLAIQGIRIPASVISAGFHRADLETATTTIYYAVPSISAAEIPSDTNQSFKFTLPAAFINDRVLWAADWFRVFKSKY